MQTSCCETWSRLWYFYPVLQSWPHKPESKSNKDTQTKTITWHKVWAALRAHRCEAPQSARQEFYQPPQKYKMSSASTAVGNSLRRSDETHTDIKTDTQEGTAGNRWKSRGGGSVFSVLVCVCGPWRHKYPVAIQVSQTEGPQGQQRLSMTSVMSNPYTSSRSIRKERSPWGSSPMALTCSVVRVGSMLPATSDRVWKMRLFSSMKNLGQD